MTSWRKPMISKGERRLKINAKSPSNGRREGQDNAGPSQALFRAVSAEDLLDLLGRRRCHNGTMGRIW
jgi:hypothetical protein